jgi:hypothetical protein
MQQLTLPALRPLVVAIILGLGIAGTGDTQAAEKTATVAFSSGPNAVPLLELYSSEGCSSCPPAERWLGGKTDDAGLWRDFVPVSFHVNYWDRLGWKDALASPAYTERQYAYAAAWGTRNVYTPEFVFQGREWHPGDPHPPVQSAGKLELTREGDGGCVVRFSPASQDKEPKAYTVQIAVLGGGIVSSVKAGENSGRTLHHEFVAGALLSAPLAKANTKQEDEAAVYEAHVAAPVWPTDKTPAPRRQALIAWVSRTGDLTPLQATGGWLPE